MYSFSTENVSKKYRLELVKEKIITSQDLLVLVTFMTSLTLSSILNTYLIIIMLFLLCKDHVIRSKECEYLTFKDYLLNIFVHYYSTQVS